MSVNEANHQGFQADSNHCHQSQAGTHNHFGPAISSNQTERQRESFEVFHSCALVHTHHASGLKKSCLNELSKSLLSSELISVALVLLYSNTHLSTRIARMYRFINPRRVLNQNKLKTDRHFFGNSTYINC